MQKINAAKISACSYFFFIQKRLQELRVHEKTKKNALGNAFNRMYFEIKCNILANRDKKLPLKTLLRFLTSDLEEKS